MFLIIYLAQVRPHLSDLSKLKYRHFLRTIIIAYISQAVQVLYAINFCGGGADGFTPARKDMYSVGNVACSPVILDGKC